MTWRYHDAFEEARSLELNQEGAYCEYGIRYGADPEISQCVVLRGQVFRANLDANTFFILSQRRKAENGSLRASLNHKRDTIRKLRREVTELRALINRWMGGTHAVKFKKQIHHVK